MRKFVEDQDEKRKSGENGEFKRSEEATDDGKSNGRGKRNTPREVSGKFGIGPMESPKKKGKGDGRDSTPTSDVSMPTLDLSQVREQPYKFGSWHTPDGDPRVFPTGCNWNPVGQPELFSQGTRGDGFRPSSTEIEMQQWYGHYKPSNSAVTDLGAIGVQSGTERSGTERSDDRLEWVDKWLSNS